MKTSWVLSKAPVMDVKTPIATWILARLFNDDIPVTRKNLLRNLCQASFDSMTNDEDFSEAIRKLENAKYIEYARKKHTELAPIHNPVLITMSTGMQEVERTIEGYTITEAGIMAFRRQIITPLEKIIPHVSKTRSSKIPQFAEIVTTLSSTINLAKSVVDLCTNNAPQVLDFIKILHNDLLSLGINIAN